jgi:hypothetical protein
MDMACREENGVARPKRSAQAMASGDTRGRTSHRHYTQALDQPSGSSTCPRPGERVDRRAGEVPRKSPDGTRKRQPDPAHDTAAQRGPASTDRARRETCRGASQRTTKARTPPAERGHGRPRAEPSASNSRRMVTADTSRATRTGDAHEF